MDRKQLSPDDRVRFNEEPAGSALPEIDCETAQGWIDALLEQKQPLTQNQLLLLGVHLADPGLQHTSTCPVHHIDIRDTVISTVREKFSTAQD